MSAIRYSGEVRVRVTLLDKPGLTVERLYHVVHVHPGHGARSRMTRYACPHHEACTIMSKQSDRTRPDCRLVEVPHTDRVTLEKLLWRHTHKGYRGTLDAKGPVSDRTVLHRVTGQGTCLVRIGTLTDAEIRGKLPSHVTDMIDFPPTSYTVHGVLAGAYLGKAPKLEHTLTHASFHDHVGRAVCGKVLHPNLCDPIEAPEVELTCAACVRAVRGMTRRYAPEDHRPKPT